jgi:predicted ArsR family transcriptional regulator
LIFPANLENVSDGFSEPKKKILYYLKVMQQAGLEELAKVMKVSRMAVHKHLVLLQNRGLVEGIENRGHVGRPRMVYQLTSQSKTVFPKSYSAIATHALDFIERNMGKEGIEKVLRERQTELFDQYYKRLKDLDFDKQVKELARIRDEEGYIASTETELFEKLLGANIETTHRAAKGDLICKFIIKEKKEEYF